MAEAGEEIDAAGSHCCKVFVVARLHARIAVGLQQCGDECGVVLRAPDAGEMLSALVADKTPALLVGQCFVGLGPRCSPRNFGLRDRGDDLVDRRHGREIGRCVVHTEVRRDGQSIGALARGIDGRVVDRGDTDVGDTRGTGGLRGQNMDEPAAVGASELLLEDGEDVAGAAAGEFLSGLPAVRIEPERLPAILHVGRLAEDAVPSFVGILDVELQGWVHRVAVKPRGLADVIVIGCVRNADPAVLARQVGQRDGVFMRRALGARLRVREFRRALRPVRHRVEIGLQPIHESQAAIR